MKIDLIVDISRYQMHMVTVKINRRLIKKKYIVAFDDCEFEAFEGLINTIRIACIDVGRADISSSLRVYINEHSKHANDEFDNYTQESIDFEFKNGELFKVVHGDCDLCQNTEYEDLIRFLNDKILVNVDAAITLTVKGR